MDELSELKLIKNFIILSILVNSDKKFLLPDYDRKNEYQMRLYKGLSELKKEGKIFIKLSAEGNIIISLKS